MRGGLEECALCCCFDRIQNSKTKTEAIFHFCGEQRNERFYFLKKNLKTIFIPNEKNKSFSTKKKQTKLKNAKTAKERILCRIEKHINFSSEASIFACSLNLREFFKIFFCKFTFYYSNFTVFFTYQIDKF